VHKNGQNSVEFIPDIRFDVGMDARQMKKVIQYEALGRLKQNILDQPLENMRNYDIGILLDKSKASDAEVRRFMKVLEEMLVTALINYPIDDVEFDFGG